MYHLSINKYYLHRGTNKNLNEQKYQMPSNTCFSHLLCINMEKNIREKFLKFSVKVFQKPINPAKCSPSMENIISVINHDSKRCNLCSTKKYHILTSLVDLINWRTDFISKCRHCDKNIIYFYYIHVIYIYL